MCGDCSQIALRSIALLWCFPCGYRLLDTRPGLRGWSKRLWLGERTSECLPGRSEERPRGRRLRRTLLCHSRLYEALCGAVRRSTLCSAVWCGTLCSALCSDRRSCSGRMRIHLVDRRYRILLRSWRRRWRWLMLRWRVECRLLRCNAQCWTRRLVRQVDELHTHTFYMVISGAALVQALFMVVHNLCKACAQLAISNAQGATSAS